MTKSPRPPGGGRGLGPRRPGESNAEVMLAAATSQKGRASPDDSSTPRAVLVSMALLSVSKRQATADDGPEVGARALAAPGRANC